MIRYTISALALMILSGCYDRFSGPTLRNGYDMSIEINIRYDDLSESSQEWPPCFEAFIGKTAKPEDVIREIEVKKNGKVVHLMDAAKVKYLLEKEELHDGYSAWNIGPDGILFDVSPDLNCTKKGSDPFFERIQRI